MDAAEEALRQEGELDGLELSDAEHALEQRLPPDLQAAFKAFTAQYSAHMAWRERVAYTFGLCVGRQLNGGRR